MEACGRIMNSQEHQYDVVVIGGALAGASTATCLLQKNPDLRVLIVERSDAFKWRVGEATVEVSGYFLTRILGLTHHLNREHLVKQGFRFWFQGKEPTPFERCTEIGGRYLARIPAFQVDRAILDEEVLRRAVAAGAELWRPAQVDSVDLKENANQTLRIRRNDQTTEVTARWVVDASGVAAMLSRQLGWWKSNDRHPTSAVWARWQGVGDWDDPQLERDHPEWGRDCYGVRDTATNHLMGDGWWAWWIPLRSGEVSIGVVYDQRLFQWPTGGSLGEQLRSVICSHPVGKKILKEGQFIDGDVHLRKNLAWCSTSLAQDGLVLVGDASAFLDPFYSAGLDWLSFTAYTAAELILAERQGEEMPMRIDKHNQDLGRSYERWFETLYLDKYELMGDADLLGLAFELDLGLYYVGVVTQPYRRGPVALTEPFFSVPGSRPAFHLMRTYNRRLVRIARARRARGTFGRCNTDRRIMLEGFTLSNSSNLRLLKVLFRWMFLELREGWRSWFRWRQPSTTHRSSDAAAEPSTADPKATSS
jgi:flavin-dependent dehydrogenase